MNYFLHSPQKKLRDSNMELLRIVTMSMIVVLHLIVYLLENTEYSSNSFFSLFWIKYTKSLTIVSVNVFVMLSGWYGIHLKWQRFSELWFQVIFWGLIGLCIGFLCKKDISLSYAIKYLLLANGDMYGFFQSYIILYIISPLLNLYIDTAKKDQIISLLLAFFIIQLLWGCLSWGYIYFGNGYSCVSFMGIYLLARFAKKNYIGIRFSSFLYIGFYFLLSFVGTMITISLSNWNSGAFAFWGEALAYSYASPIVIISAFSFLCYFSKIRIKPNQVINYISKHSFAVYLFHINIFILPTFLHLCSSYIDGQLHHFIILAIVACICIFAVSVILDSFRLGIWNYILYFSRTRINHRPPTNIP